jgi:hypothetical protein
MFYNPRRMRRRVTSSSSVYLPVTTTVYTKTYGLMAKRNDVFLRMITHAHKVYVLCEYTQ